jgi:uncharacterized SAM-binding protein YcdF (DUF218 family)
MQLTLSENLLWWLGIGLKILLCFLVFYRRLYRRLPFFSFYAALLVVEVIVVWWVYREWGYRSLPAWYTYWLALAVVLFARALVVGELCWTSLRTYPAIWPWVRRLLSPIALVALSYAAVTALRTSSSPLAAFVLASERALEIAFAVILVAFVGFGARYLAVLGPVERNIVIGLGVYSGFQVINNTFMQEWMSRYFHWWVSMRVIAFDMAMLVWIVPLRKTLPPAETGRALISERAAIRLLRELLASMREITEELKRIARSKWK